MSLYFNYLNDNDDCRHYAVIIMHNVTVTLIITVKSSINFIAIIVISFHFIFDKPRSRETTQNAKTPWVGFDKGGYWSTRRKPSKSGWDQLKTQPHTTLVVEVRGVLMIEPVWLTQEYSTGEFPDVHPSSYQPRQTRLHCYARTGTSVSLLVQTIFSWFCSRLHFYYQQCHFSYHHEFDLHVPDSYPLLPS